MPDPKHGHLSKHRLAKSTKMPRKIGKFTKRILQLYYVLSRNEQLYIINGCCPLGTLAANCVIVFGLSGPNGWRWERGGDFTNFRGAGYVHTYMDVYTWLSQYLFRFLMAVTEKLSGYTCSVR